MIPRRIAQTFRSYRPRTALSSPPSRLTLPTLAHLSPTRSDRRTLSSTAPPRSGLPIVNDEGIKRPPSSADPSAVQEEGGMPRAEHAVISTFDLFSIGVGPSSSHTVGPMRAANIFVKDLQEMGLLDKVKRLKVGLYGSLAATGKGHMTPEAVMMGLEGSDPESIETTTIQSRYQAILQTEHLQLNGSHTIKYSMDRDMLWRVEPLPTHPNGMRFTVFGEEGDMIATNEYFSVGGGFVVNNRTQVDENLYYRETNKDDASKARRDQSHGIGAGTPLLAAPGEEDGAKAEGSQKAKQPPYLFRNAQGLLMMTQQHNLTIAQLVWNNELAFMTPQQISDNLLKIWAVMDGCIHDGVTSTEERLPGRLGVRRRAAGLYRRLFKGFYPSIPSRSSPSLPSPAPKAISSSSSESSSLSMQDGFNSPPPSDAYTPSHKRSRAPLVIGDFEHDLPVVPWKNTVFPGIDFLSAYAIAVNEVNASGGRVVTAPTNGASGVIPAVLKYVLEFISDSPERDVKTFLLTAAAVGMLYKRGSTISAAEGGCMAEVGVASSMAAAGFAACLGGTPSQILQAAEIGIEHSLGLTCDPIDGLVQVPCIERNSLGAVKAVTAAQLALAGDGIHSVSLDEAIEAMRVTARDMHTHYKETSMSGLATTVRIPLSSPAC
ncbi:L-serine ammonia-lyase [Meredithblackwellia eburnea MCA 4105]